MGQPAERSRTERYASGRTEVQEVLGHRAVAYSPALAAVAGGVTAGVFLSQLFYWHDKGWDPDGWIHKTQDEWEAETGLTRREQETARRRLRKCGILEEKLSGIPARLHYRLDVDRLIDLLTELRQSRLAESAKQAWRKPPDKHVRKRHTSLAESAQHAETTREHSTERKAETTAAAGSQFSLCSIHGQPMKLRRSGGDTWYSHRLPDGSWCKGAPGDQGGSGSRRDRVDVQSWAYRREYATQFGFEVSLEAPSDRARPSSEAARSWPASQVDEIPTAAWQGEDGSAGSDADPPHAVDADAEPRARPRTDVIRPSSDPQRSCGRRCRAPPGGRPA